MLLKQQNNEITDKDSKLSHDTINSSQHMNSEDANLTMSAMNTSLSYNCLSNLNQANLFIPSANNQNTNDSYNILNNQFNNFNNLRRSLFVTNCDSNKQINTKTLNNRNSILNDPLGHIYETISVSSVSNANLNSFNTNNNQIDMDFQRTLEKELFWLI